VSDEDDEEVGAPATTLAAARLPSKTLRTAMAVGEVGGTK